MGCALVVFGGVMFLLATARAVVVLDAAGRVGGLTVVYEAAFGYVVAFGAWAAAAVIFELQRLREGLERLTGTEVTAPDGRIVPGPSPLLEAIRPPVPPERDQPAPPTTG